MEWPKGTVHATDKDFDKIIAGYPKILVDFYADWCGPCRMVGPVIEELAREMNGETVFVKVNVDESRETAMKHGVMSIPTMVIYKEGKIVDNFVGALPKAMLKQKLEQW